MNDDSYSNYVNNNNVFRISSFLILNNEFFGYPLQFVCETEGRSRNHEHYPDVHGDNIKYNKCDDNKYNKCVHKITYYSYNKLFSKDGVLNQGIQICKLYHVNKNKKIKQIIFEALKNKITFSYDNNPNNIKKKIYKFLKKNCAYHDLIKLFYFKGHKQREKCNKKLNMEKTFGVHKSSRYNYKTYKKKKKIDMCKNYCDDILDTYNSKYYKGELSGQHKHIKMTGEQKEEHHIKYTHLNFNHGKDETFYKELYKCNYIEKYISSTNV
ncbi:hypothetical protein C923_01138 [Plasmodium falciparum UGT5.1]|uniref:Uncharacterized protein n=1 Tax=Plasmodium falciparum UGT5.1 TaxID=1237627 RepID=W7K2Q6_PLAFA|nr:hypothetical protein C923_01138 [Plasmodium falciparum UGT5.1]